MNLQQALASATGVKIDYLENKVSLITRFGEELYSVQPVDRGEVNAIAGDWDKQVKQAVAARRVPKPW